MPSNSRNNNPLAASSLQEMPESAEVATAEKHTYGQILKSSALIGGSSVLTIAIGIVRTKATAVLLGPAGFGLLGAVQLDCRPRQERCDDGRQQQQCLPDR